MHQYRAVWFSGQSDQLPTQRDCPSALLIMLEEPAGMKVASTAGTTLPAGDGDAAHSDTVTSDELLTQQCDFCASWRVQHLCAINYNRMLKTAF
jgi:hypothetical protein